MTDNFSSWLVSLTQWVVCGSITRHCSDSSQMSCQCNV